jgi:hypothetical protein
MSRPFLSKDLAALVRGAQLVAKEAAKIQEAEIKRRWDNSSVRVLLEQQGQKISACTSDIKSAQDLQVPFREVKKLILINLSRLIFFL